MLVCDYEHPENVQFYPLTIWTFKLKSVLLLIFFTKNEEDSIKNDDIGGDEWWWEVSGLTWWTSAGPWVWGCQAPAASYTCCGSLTGDVYGASSSSTYFQKVQKYKKILLCLCLHKFLGQQLLITMNSSKTRMSNCVPAVTK